MRKLLLCLGVTAICLFLTSPPSQAVPPILAPICLDYCCYSSAATSTTKCWHNSVLRTCGWYWQNYECP